MDQIAGAFTQGHAALRRRGVESAIDRLVDRNTSTGVNPLIAFLISKQDRDEERYREREQQAQTEKRQRDAERDEKEDRRLREQRDHDMRMMQMQAAIIASLRPPQYNNNNN